jgi:preprotein translocase subunit SecB
MSQFDPKIQVRATLATRSILQVDIPAYELRDPLQVGLALQLHWRAAAQPNHYIAIGTLQVHGHLADGRTAFVAEATLHQVSEVSGYTEAEMAEVLEARLPDVLLPYLRAHVANLMLPSGYHHVTLPAHLNPGNLRATEQVPAVQAAQAGTPAADSAEAAPDAAGEVVSGTAEERAP